MDLHLLPREIPIKELGNSDLLIALHEEYLLMLEQVTFERTSRLVEIQHEIIRRMAGKVA